MSNLFRPTTMAEAKAAYDRYCIKCYNSGNTPDTFEYWASDMNIRG